jgi:hypothetical protein
MAWDFVMNFARDNSLRVVEGVLLPDGSFQATPQADPAAPADPVPSASPVPGASAAAPIAPPAPAAPSP